MQCQPVAATYPLRHADAAVSTDVPSTLCGTVPLPAVTATVAAPLYRSTPEPRYENVCTLHVPQYMASKADFHARPRSSNLSDASLTRSSSTESQLHADTVVSGSTYRSANPTRISVDTRKALAIPVAPTTPLPAVMQATPAAGMWTLQRIHARAQQARVQAVEHHNHVHALELLAAVHMSLDKDYCVSRESAALTERQRVRYAGIVAREMQYIVALWTEKLQCDAANHEQTVTSARLSGLHRTPSAPSASDRGEGSHKLQRVERMVDLQVVSPDAVATVQQDTPCTEQSLSHTLRSGSFSQRNHSRRGGRQPIARPPVLMHTASGDALDDEVDAPPRALPHRRATAEGVPRRPIPRQVPHAARASGDSSLIGEIEAAWDDEVLGPQGRVPFVNRDYRVETWTTLSENERSVHSTHPYRRPRSPITAGLRLCVSAPDVLLVNPRHSTTTSDEVWAVAQDRVVRSLRTNPTQCHELYAEEHTVLVECAESQHDAVPATVSCVPCPSVHLTRPGGSATSWSLIVAMEDQNDCDMAKSETESTLRLKCDAVSDTTASDSVVRSSDVHTTPVHVEPTSSRVGSQASDVHTPLVHVEPTSSRVGGQASDVHTPVADAAELRRRHGSAAMGRGSTRTSLSTVLDELNSEVQRALSTAPDPGEPRRWDFCFSSQVLDGAGGNVGGTPSTALVPSLAVSLTSHDAHAQKPSQPAVGADVGRGGGVTGYVYHPPPRGSPVRDIKAQYYGERTWQHSNGVELLPRRQWLQLHRVRRQPNPVEVEAVKPRHCSPHLPPVVPRPHKEVESGEAERMWNGTNSVSLNRPSSTAQVSTVDSSCAAEESGELTEHMLYRVRSTM